MLKKLALTTALVATLATPAIASASPTADLTVDPVALRTSSRTVNVTGTYRCTPTPGANMGQISAVLKQPGPNGSTLSSAGVSNVLCDGTTRPYSISTFGSVQNGTASYHVVLNANPTRETVVQDGTLVVQ